jgi:undecaprenyl-diphosphatase
MLDWIGLHPYWAGAAIFLASLAESLVGVGLFIPGTLVMFGVGALVTAGALDLWAVLAWAAAGAVVGDAISYWVGRHFQEQLRTLWPFRRHPGWLKKGEAFLGRHGGKSVLLGRFVGPVRPVIPAVAGMLGMAPLRFFTANILSALAWAPVYILPGVVFGASLQLAGAVATRLALMIALLVFTVWGGLWAGLHAVLWLRPRAESGLTHLQTWAAAAPGESGGLRNWAAAWLNPAPPESRAIFLFALVLIAAAWVFTGVLQDVVSRDPLVAIDSSVYHLLQGLRTPVGDAFMIAVTELGDNRVMFPVVLAVLLWLVKQRAWHAAAYCLGAVGVAGGLALALNAGLRLPRPAPLYEGATAFAFPSAHIAMSTVIFGFLGILIARGTASVWRWGAIGGIALLVFLIALSRLYLGADWLSDVIGGLAFGVIWLALSGIAYTHHAAPRIPALGLASVSLAALLIAGSWQVAARHQADTARYALRAETRTLAQQAWWDGAWQTLPAWRIDLEGEYEQPFTVQWAGTLEYVRSTLLQQGWREPAPLGGRNMLLLLDTTLGAMALPVLPHVHDGRHEALALIHPVAGEPNQRLVLRLWPSHTVIQESGRPLWNGMVTREILRRPLAWFNLPRDDYNFNRPRAVLQQHLATLPSRLVKRGPKVAGENGRVVWDRQVLLAREPEQP